LQRRKPIALVGYFLAAIGKPLMGLATVWQVVFGARLLDRFGAGTRSAPRDALIASSVSEENRGRAFGLEGVGDNAGAFLGPLFAVFPLYSLHVGIRSVFYLAVIPGPIAFLLVLLVKETPVAVAAKAKIDFGLRQFPMGYWKYLLVTALFALGNSSNAFLILRTQDIGASLEMTILIYAAFNLVAALISYPAGSLSDSWGAKKCPTRFIHYLPDQLFRLRADAKRGFDRRFLCVLWIVPRNFSYCGESDGIEARQSCRRCGRIRACSHDRRRHRPQRPWFVAHLDGVLARTAARD
jgi:MFS family permease